MSLFKLRDAWSYRFPNEEFETRGLCLGDILNDNNNNNKEQSSQQQQQQQVVVGSFSGMLRIFKPNTRNANSVADDLLLEHNVGAPILQVGIAPVHKSPDSNSLIVLCPRKLVFLNIVKVDPNKQENNRKQQQQLQAQQGGEEGEEDNKLTSLLGGGGGGGGNSSSNFLYRVEPVAELIQQRTAHSFVTGLFGRPPNNIHGVCVQSMDGNLDFYSGMHLSFNRFLPSSSFLVPGSLCYVDCVDSFLVATSTFCVEFYKFSTFGSASGASENNNNKQLTEQARKLIPDWNCVIGEDILSIKECRLSDRRLEGRETEIAVLSEHSLLLLTSTKGEAIFNIRLDYAPMCMTVFPKPPPKAKSVFEKERAHQLVIASASGSFFVHCENEIVWSAKLHNSTSSDAAADGDENNNNNNNNQGGFSAPIAVEVAHSSIFCKTQGMIVVLTDNGVLSLCYLGTDPALNQSVQVLAREELDIASTIKENAELQEKIRQGKGGDDPFIARNQDSNNNNNNNHQEKETPAVVWDPLELTFDPPMLDYQQGLVSMSFYLVYPGESDLIDVVLAISCADPIAADSHTHTIAFLPGKSRVSIPVSFGIKPELQNILPSSLFVEAVATYYVPLISSSSSSSGGDGDNNNNPTSSAAAAAAATAAAGGGSSGAGAGAVGTTGRAVISRTSCALPLGLVCRPIPPISKSPFKLQIEVSNRTEVPQCDQLFDDIAAFNPEHVSTHTMSAQFSNGVDASVLLSKNGSRYRVCSSTFAGLWLLTSELLRRLRKVCNNVPPPGGQQQQQQLPEIAFEFPDEIPLAELYLVIDSHFAARLQLGETSARVEKLSEQMRAVQRRLIARFREQNPAPGINSMQQLFEVTYRSLRDSCEVSEQAALNLKVASSGLACAIHLTLLLSRYKLKLDRDEFELLRHVLSPAVEDSILCSASSAEQQHQHVGWEETTVTGLTHMLRTTLSKSKAGGAEGIVVAQPLSIQTDTSKVKKNIQSVFEKLVKGAKMTGSQD